MHQGSVDSFERFGDIIEVDEAYTGADGFAQGPERALLSAILFDAVQILLKNSEDPGSFRSPVQEALCWVTTRDSDYIFSFENVCEGLGISPDSLRLGLINAVNTRRQRSIRRGRIRAAA